MASNTNEDLHVTIYKFVQEKYGGNVKFEIMRGANEKDSYVSDIFRIKVWDESGEKIKQNNYDTFVCKIMKPNKVSTEVKFVKNTFRREITVYKELFKEYTKLEKQFGVNEIDRFKYAQVFYTSLQSGREIIVMEDLKDSNFQLIDRFTPIDLQHIMLIIKRLSKVHALYFALKAYKPDVCLDLKPKITDSEVSDLDEFIKHSNQKAIDILETEEDKVKLMNYFKTYDQETNTVEKENNPYFVFCHGDCWINNFMFKYEENKVDPTDVMIIDWQVMTYSSPIEDVLHLISLTTDSNFRKENYRTVIEYYYKNLSRELLKFKLSIDEVYPRHVFEKDQIKCLRNALSAAIGGLPFVLSQNDVKLNLDDVYGNNIEFSKVIYSDLIVKRLREYILDVLNLVYTK